MVIDRRDGLLGLEDTGLPISIDSWNQLLSVALTMASNVSVNPTAGKTWGSNFDEVSRPNRDLLAVASAVGEKIHD